MIQKILFYLTVTLFGLGQLGRVQLFDRPIYLYVYEIPMAFFILFGIFQYGFASFHARVSHFRSLYLFVIWSIISLGISLFFYSPYENIIAALYLIKVVLYGSFIIFIYYDKNISEKLTQNVGIYITGWIIFSSLCQYFLYPNIGNIAYLGWDPHLYRLVGVFLDPPIAAAIYALFLLSHWQNFNARNITIWKIIVLGLLISCFTLTYSRGGYIAFLITVLYYLFRIKKPYYILVFSLLIIVAFVCFPKSNVESTNLFRLTSVNARSNDNKIGLAILKKSPFFGVGYNHIRFEKDDYNSERFKEDYNPSHGVTAFQSSFLTVLVTTGFIGFVLFLWVLISFARMNMFLELSILYLSIASLFDNVILHPFIIFILGILGVLAVKQKKGSKGVNEPFHI